MNQLIIGLKNEISKIVTENMLASSVGSGTVNVLATPMMIAGIEETASQSVETFLFPDKTTVGIDISISHLAATPKGMKVTFKTEICKISENGKIITFKVQAYDEKELIGEGTHKRAIINKEKFEQKALNK